MPGFLGSTGSRVRAATQRRARRREPCLRLRLAREEPLRLRLASGPTSSPAGWLAGWLATKLPDCADQYAPEAKLHRRHYVSGFSLDIYFGAVDNQEDDRLGGQLIHELVQLG